MEEHVPDAADELDFDEFEPTPEEEDLMALATRKEETRPLHQLPPEEEDMQGHLVKEAGLELIGGHGLSAINTVSEIFQSSKSNVTTSKKKYIEAWKEKNEVKPPELTKKN